LGLRLESGYIGYFSVPLLVPKSKPYRYSIIGFEIVISKMFVIAIVLVMVASLSKFIGFEGF